MAKQIVGEAIEIKGLKGGGIEIINDEIFKEKATLSEFEEAWEAIRLGLAEGYRPTNKQFDMIVGAMIQIALPDEERPWFRECATSNRVPLWIMLLSHWRRSQEQGSGFNLFLDPGWDKLAEQE